MLMILTNKGADLASVGFVTGDFPKISKVKFGDGNGAPITHTAESTNIARVVYETQAVAGIREERVTNIVAEIPITVGGFTVREIGLFTENDELVAVTQTCNFYKPNMDNDPTQETLYMRIAISDTQCIDIEFNTDILYASQTALNETNEHLQRVEDELRKKKLLMLNSSSVLLDGKVDVLGKENKMFSNTFFYTGDGVSTGKVINIGMEAKQFNTKNNGSGFYLEYVGASATLVVKDDNDNIIPEGDISFPTIKAEILRTDTSQDKYRYSSLIGLKISQVMNVSTSGGEAITDHILGISGSNMTVSKVINTLNGTYLINIKYMDRIRWYTAPDGGVWIQAYNLETSYFINYGKVVSATNRYEIRNPLKKPIDCYLIKSLTGTATQNVCSSAMGETRYYQVYQGTNNVATDRIVNAFSEIDYFIKDLPLKAIDIIYLECFANSKYMVSGLFTMSSTTDNNITIKDVDGNDRLVSRFQFKSLINTNFQPVLFTVKNRNFFIIPYGVNNGLISTVVKFTTEKGKLTINDYAAHITANQLYHYIVEFDSELSNVIDNIGEL